MRPVVEELETGTEAQRVLIAIALGRRLIVQIDAHGFNAVIQNDVNNARHGIRAVRGRSAAGYRFNAADKRGRNEIHVHAATVVGWRHSARIDQR